MCTEPAGVARRAALLNGEIEIASQVVRSAEEPQEVEVAHVSSDGHKPGGTLGMLHDSGKGSDGFLWSSDDKPGIQHGKKRKLGEFRELVSTSRRDLTHQSSKANEQSAAAGSGELTIPTPTPETSPDHADLEASTEPDAQLHLIVPASRTSQGVRRIGLVSYSSTVPSAEPSSLDTDSRPVLADIDPKTQANRSKGKLKQIADGESQVQPCYRTAENTQQLLMSKPAEHPTPALPGRRAPPTLSSVPSRPIPTHKARQSQAFTFDSILGPGEGSYALPAPPPADEHRRKRQREAFEGVEAVDGDGPYGYYNCESI